MSENTTPNQVSPREHALSIAVVLFILAAMCFMDVGTSGDGLFLIPGILVGVGGLYALRRWRRLS